MATDSQTLVDQAKCYICLGITLGEALQLALLAQIVNNGGGGGGGGTNDISTTAADPNAAGLVPANPALASTFYQDPSVPGGIFNVWRWSITNHTWVQFSSP